MTQFVTYDSENKNLNKLLSKKDHFCMPLVPYIYHYYLTSNYNFFIKVVFTYLSSNPCINVTFEKLKEKIDETWTWKLTY